MYQKYPIKKSILRYVFIILGAVILVGASLFTLEKTGITNLYSNKPNDTSSSYEQTTSEESGTNPTNTIDYSPPKAEDISTIPDKNPSGTSPISPPNAELSVIITSIRHPDNLLLIKAIITGTDNATCEAVMKKGSIGASASSGATLIEGQYSCKDLSIPMTQLTETGEWALILTVTDKNGSQASTTEKVIL